jgi:hypothetical protein
MIVGSWLFGKPKCQQRLSLKLCPKNKIELLASLVVDGSKEEAEFLTSKKECDWDIARANKARGLVWSSLGRLGFDRVWFGEGKGLTGGLMAGMRRVSSV